MVILGDRFHLDADLLGPSHILSVITQDGSLVKMGGCSFSFTCDRPQWSWVLILGLPRERPTTGKTRQCSQGYGGLLRDSWWLLAKEKVFILASFLQPMPVSPEVCQEAPSVYSIPCITPWLLQANGTFSMLTVRGHI